MSIAFKAGTFIELRATTTFHLGSIEKDVNKGDVVEFDGVTLKLGDSKHNISAVSAAIKAGWLVPVSDTTTVFRPVAAGVQVHPAMTAGRERGSKVEIPTVHDEDRNLGTIKSVRDRGDGSVKKKMVVEADDASAEGIAVGRVNRPAVSKMELTASNEMRLAQEARRLDNPEGAGSAIVTPLRQPRDTGARVAGSLDDLLTDGDAGVVVARLPPISRTTPLGEGDSPHLTESEKSERLGASREAAAANRAARVAASAATDTSDSAPTAPEVVEAAAEVLPADLGQKVQFVRAVIPNFEWDMTRSWKTRVVDAVKRYGKNPLYLNGILSVETDTVRTHIAQALMPKT